MTSSIVLDVDPSGKTDARSEILRGQAASLKDPTHPPLHFPGGNDAQYLLLDTLVLDALVPLEGAGWLRRGPQWPLGLNGQGRHLVVWQNSAATVTVRGVCFDGNAAAQTPGFVGDNWRAQHVAGVDMADAHNRNMRGLTTHSTPTLPETFAAQLLHVQHALLQRCHTWSDDGSATATGIVFHWVDDWTLRDTIVAYLKGQLVGSFGAGRGTIDHCGLAWGGHGINVEAGNTAPGGDVTVLGGDRASWVLGCKAAVCVNGNYGHAVQRVQSHELYATQCDVLLDVAGLPAPVSLLDTTIDSPHLAIARAEVGTLQAARDWASRIALTGKLRKDMGIPVYSWGGKEQSFPKTWDFAPF